MTRNFPASIDTWPAAAFYAGKTLAAAGSTTWPEDVGDQFEAIQNRIGATGATDLSTITAQIDYVRTGYTPSWQGANITTHPTTWSGTYAKSGHLGLLSIKGVASGTWSGATSGAYVEVSLPSAWTGQATFEAAVMVGYAELSGGAFGLHYPLQGVVHPGANGVRLICPALADTVTGSGVTGSPKSIVAAPWFAMDGVTIPFAFTSGCALYLNGFVILA